jgi:transcriptional regulator with XRE-family HTH domain
MSNKKTTTMANPDPIDVRFGKLLRVARTACGMSQEKLGDINGLTFQQIQKYERGTNRVSISRLMRIADSLGMPATWFIEKLCGEATPEQEPTINARHLDPREVHALLRAYTCITKKSDRRTMCRVMTLVAARNGDMEDEIAENGDGQ